MVAEDRNIYKELYSVSKDIVSNLEPDKALQKIIDSAVCLTSAVSGSVALLNPNMGQLEILASRGLDNDAKNIRLEVGRGITGHVAATGETIMINDVSEDNRYVSIRENVQSELACPLEIDGHAIGVINVDSEKKQAFSDNDITILLELSSLAAKVINNAWRHEQVLHRVSLFSALTRIGQTINSSLTLEETLNVVVLEACSLIDGKLSSIMLINQSDPGLLEIKATHGAGKSYTDSRRTINIEESLMGIVIRRRKPIQISDVFESNRFQNQDMAREEGLVAVLSVPLKTQDAIMGTLNIYKGKSHRFSNEEVECVSVLAELAAIAIHRATLYGDIAAKERQINQNEKLSALGLLAAEVAHEIRNPLTVIKMLFHSMELDFGEQDPRTEDTRIISEKMNQLNEIVERVLRFARNSEPVISDVNLNKELEDLVSLIRVKLDKGNITLVKEFSSVIPNINGDSLQINQAILNIVINALEAMDEGGKLILRTQRISSDTSSDRIESEDRVLVEIADTGKGIPQGIQQKLLSPILHSTKSSGTGIGLALVKKIMDTHKAELIVDSDSGKGASVKIIFQQKPQFD